jgi:hypothetical protein
MNTISKRTLSAAVLLAALGSMVPGCSAMGFRIRSPFTRVKEEPRFGSGQLTAAAIQSEIMSFTDTFGAAVAEQWNRIAAESRARTESAQEPLSPDELARANRIRRSAVESKLATVSAALSIASSPNPTVALADIITLVTLQRMVFESQVTVERFGMEHAADLIALYTKQEEKVWRIAARAMSEEQQLELRELIDDWREQNPDSTYVANIRLEDFARTRQVTVVEQSAGGDSLLSLFALDPLAGLDPAQREVQKSRMLGERMFFYASRLPQILKWQVESLSQELLRSPEIVRMSDSMERVTESISRVTAVAEQLPEDVAAERKAALDELFSKVTAARTAAIADVAHTLSAQREEFVEDLDQAQGKFQHTLGELSETADSTQQAATTLTETIRAADAFAARLKSSGGDHSSSGGDHSQNQDPDRNGLADYQAAVAQTGDAADRLTTLTQNLGQLLDSEALGEQSQAVQAAVLEAKSGAKDVIDYAFLRLLALALLTPFAVALAAGLYRRANRRYEARLVVNGPSTPPAAMQDNAGQDHDILQPRRAPREAPQPPAERPRR